MALAPAAIKAGLVNFQNSGGNHTDQQTPKNLLLCSARHVSCVDAADSRVATRPLRGLPARRRFPAGQHRRARASNSIPHTCQRTNTKPKRELPGRRGVWCGAKWSWIVLAPHATHFLHWKQLLDGASHARRCRHWAAVAQDRAALPAFVTCAPNHKTTGRSHPTL